MIKYILILIVLLSCGHKEKKIDGIQFTVAPALQRVIRFEMVADTGTIFLKPISDTVFIHDTTYMLDTDKYPDGSMLYVADGKLYPIVFRPMEFTYRKPKRKKPVMLLPQHNYDDIHLRVDTNLYKRWSDSVIRFMDTSIIIKDTHILP